MRTRKIFIWTQYYDADFRDRHGKPLSHKTARYSKHGLDLPIYQLQYRNRLRRDFFGGIRPRTHWLARDGILAALRHFGFETITVIKDDRAGERGPSVTLAASR